MNTVERGYFLTKIAEVFGDPRVPNEGMPKLEECLSAPFHIEELTTLTKISTVVARIFYNDPLSHLLESLLKGDREECLRAFDALSIQDKAFLSFSVYAAHDPASEDSQYGEHEILRDPFILLNTRVGEKNVVIKRLDEPYEKIPVGIGHSTLINRELATPESSFVRRLSVKASCLGGRDFHKLKEALCLLPSETYQREIFRQMRRNFPFLSEKREDLDRITSEDVSVRLLFAEEVASRRECGRLSKYLDYFNLPRGALKHLEKRLHDEDPDFIIHRPPGFSERDLGNIPLVPSRYIIRHLSQLYKTPNYGELTQELYEEGVCHSVKEIEEFLKMRLEREYDQKTLFLEVLELCGKRRAQLSRCAGVTSELQFGVLRDFPSPEVDSCLATYSPSYGERLKKRPQALVWKSETAELALSGWTLAPYGEPVLLHHPDLWKQPAFIPEIGRCFF